MEMLSVSDKSSYNPVPYFFPNKHNRWNFQIPIWGKTCSISQRWRPLAPLPGQLTQGDVTSVTSVHMGDPCQL